MVEHCGLTFTGEHIRQARAERDREPFRSAWAFLLEQEQTGALSAAQWNALRYRFDDDTAVGERAVRMLLDLGVGYNGEVLDQLTTLLALAQTFEMLRDHPAFDQPAPTAWLESLAVTVSDFHHAADRLSPLEQLWLGTLNIAAGVVLEREDWFEAGADIYRQTIHDDVRPEGFLPQAVDGRDGGSLFRQLLSVKALVLSAEIAAHAGADLWGYAIRGVSVMTACAYLFFYYYYPEKWRWDTLVEGEAPRLFREHGGFLELVNRRARPRDARLMLDELRPIYDVTGGGLTTLTHGVPTRRGLFK
ncbi:MAG: alginate lyase family protein [Chloroflexi bacterium]|nr:alginate lyase family protein [Chloroflexota bacterium]